MSQTVDHAAAVAAAARAVEESWDAPRPMPGHSADCYRDGDLDVCPLCAWSAERSRCVADWLAARRAAQAAGYVEVLVSGEAVEALRGWKAYADDKCPCCDVGDSTARCTCGAPDYPDPLPLLARDLGPLIKEPA